MRSCIGHDPLHTLIDCGNGARYTHDRVLATGTGVYLGHFLARFFRRKQALLAEGVETWQSLERREEVRATMQVSSSRIFSKAVTSATTEGAWAISDAGVL